MNECPICAFLSGRKYREDDALCCECKENGDLHRQWQWHSIVRQVAVQMKVVIWVYPFMIAASWAMLRYRGARLSFVSWFMMFVSFASVLFSWWWFKPGVRLEESKEKMFVLKVRGNVSP